MSEQRTIRVVRHDTGEAVEMWEGTPCINVCEAPRCGCDEEIDGERLRVLSIDGTPLLVGGDDSYTVAVAKVDVAGEERVRSCITLAHHIFAALDEYDREACFIEIGGEWVRCHAETWRARAARLDADIRAAGEALAALGAGRNDGETFADAIRRLGPCLLRCARCGAFLARGQGLVRGPTRELLEPCHALCLDCDDEVMAARAGLDLAALDDPAKHASSQAFIKAIEMIEALPATVDGEAMRAAAREAIADHATLPLEAEEYESPEEIAEALEHLKDPARREAFNAHPRLPPRIKVIPVEPTRTTLGFADGPGFHDVASMLTYPRSPRGEAVRDFRREHAISRRDLATALCVSMADVCGLERGSHTTDQAGWEEIQTALFLLGSGTKPEHIVDPANSPRFKKAMAEVDGPQTDEDRAAVALMPRRAEPDAGRFKLGAFGVERVGLGGARRTLTGARHNEALDVGPPCDDFTAPFVGGEGAAARGIQERARGAERILLRGRPTCRGVAPCERFGGRVDRVGLRAKGCGLRAERVRERSAWGAAGLHVCPHAAVFGEGAPC